MYKEKKIATIIPAAGKGRRMGANQSKQFLNINGKPILLHTIERFQYTAEIDLIIIAADASNISRINDIVKSNNLTKVQKVIEGGTERQDSVWNCLQTLKPTDADIVIIHDAVRPFITKSLIQKVIDTTLQYSSVIVAIRPKDTIKYSSNDYYIENTLSRSNLWIAQTPQCFDYKLLFNAYKKAYNDNFRGTDDASLVERLGNKIRIVEGSHENIKITTSEDLELANLINQRFTFETTNFNNI